VARRCILHKNELQMTDWSHDEIVANVVDITNTLVGRATVAMTRGDKVWLARHEWFAEVAARLFSDQPAVPLDG
jgi:hypothetical protein